MFAKLIAAMFLACFCTFSLSLHAQEIPNYNVGVVFPLSGPQAPYGEEAMRGVDLAMELLVKSDPEMARHLTLIKMDDKSLGEEAAKATELLFSKRRAHVVFGSLTGASTMEMAKVAREEKRPILSPLATTSGLTDEGFVFRSCFSEDFQGALLAVFAAKDLNQKTIAILRDDTQGAQEIADKFKRTFAKGGGKVATEEVFSITTTDFSKHIEALKKTSAAWVLLPSHYQTAGIIMQQAQEKGLGKKFLGVDSWDSNVLGKLGSAAEGHYFASHFAADMQTPEVQTFVTAFKNKYGREPGTIAALTYDGFNLLVDVLKRARTTLKKPLYKAFLSTRDLIGATGEVSLGKSGDAIKSAIIKEITASGLRFKAEVKPKIKGKDEGSAN